MAPFSLPEKPSQYLPFAGEGCYPKHNETNAFEEHIL